MTKGIVFCSCTGWGVSLIWKNVLNISRELLPFACKWRSTCFWCLENQPCLKKKKQNLALNTCIEWNGDYVLKLYTSVTPICIKQSKKGFFLPMFFSPFHSPSYKLGNQKPNSWLAATLISPWLEIFLFAFKRW